MRILIATDGSNQAKRARDLLATLAIPPRSSIQALQVFLGGQPAEGLAELGAFIEPLRAVDREVTTVARDGLPVPAILRQADLFDCDLIITGSHGRNALGLALMGSVAAGVVEGARHPVLVGRSSEVLRALFADDGSPGAAIAGGALTSGLFMGVSVVVLSVWHLQRPAVVEVPHSRRAAALRAHAAEETRLREQHQQIANAAAARLGRAGIAATVRVRVGPPAVEILSEAREAQADLVVLGGKRIIASRRWQSGRGGAGSAFPIVVLGADHSATHVGRA